MCEDPDTDNVCQVAVDTGSSLSMASPYQTSLLMEAIGLKPDCSNFKDLPTLRFEIDAADGKKFDMMLEPHEYIEQSSEGCAPTFQPLQLPPNLGRMWVLGQALLRKYYMVFDAKHWRVGLASAAHTTKQRATSAPPAAPKPHPKQEVCEDDNKHMQEAMPNFVADEDRDRDEEDVEDEDDDREA